MFKMFLKIFKYKFFIDAMVFLILGTILYCVYEPVLKAHYLFHDDFYIFGWDHTKWQEHPQFAISIKCGRLFYAFMFTFLFSFVNNVGDAKFIYVLAFLAVLFCSYLIYRSASKSVSKFLALQISLLIVTLPSFQLLASWATAASQLTAVLLSSLAAGLVAKTYEPPKTFSTIELKAMAVVLVFIAFGIHQQIAVFFWVIATLELIAVYDTKGWEVFFKRGFVFGGVFLAALVLYIPFMIYLSHFFPGQLLTNYDTSHVNFDFLSRLQWFMEFPLYRSLNLWLYPTSPMMALFVIGLLFLSAFTVTWRIWHQNKDWKVILPISLGVFVIFLGYLPVFVSHFQYTCYRNAIVITPLLLIFIIWGLKREGRVFGAIVLGLTIWVCIQTHFTISKHIVQPRQGEFDYITERFKSLSSNTIYTIQEVIPKPKESYEDDYDILTSFFSSDRPFILYAGFKSSGLPIELWKKKRHFLLDFRDTCTYKEDSKNSTTNNIVFDLNKVILPDNPYHFDCRY
ncbi:MAG: hypothetical protein HQL15_04300 [Candidatus Omnitrophica bacterium]|nr:hypothetical protein [Candidatus Omnitrophota bacterium]